MASTTDGASIAARTRMRPLQRGQASTSRAKTRRMSSAQERRRARGEDSRPAGSRAAEPGECVAGAELEPACKRSPEVAAGMRAGASLSDVSSEEVGGAIRELDEVGLPCERGRGVGPGVGTTASR